MSDWKTYQNNTKGAAKPRPLLALAVTYLSHSRRALDLGAGAMNDARYLLGLGFDVTATDGEPGFLEHAREIQSNKLHAKVERFENAEIAPDTYDLISSQFALPFATKDVIRSLVPKIYEGLCHEGIFTGNVFGMNDEWNIKGRNHISFYAREEIEKLLKDFEILYLREKEYEGRTAAGNEKHWHTIDFIAKKP